MLRRLASLSTFLLLCFCHTASAQHANWTGFQIGIHGGGVDANNTAHLNNGNQFCFSETKASGRGSASADCRFEGDTVTAFSNSDVAAFGGSSASSSSSASATPAGGAAASVAATATGVGGAGAAAATATSPQQAATFSLTQASTPFGDASAFALGLLNVVNLEKPGSLDTRGYSVGAHFGYLTQDPSNFVGGFEFDVTATPDNGASTAASDRFNFFFVDGSYGHSVSVDMNLLASARLKAGWAFGDFLPYVTGGLAYGRFDVDVSSKLAFTQTAFGPITRNVSRRSRFKEDAFGGVVGGGLSWRFTDQIIASVEGLYYMFDEEVDVSDATFNSATRETVELENVAEGRLKFSIVLN